MAPSIPSTYVRLHLLIDQDLVTRQHFVRILPPAPALDSFRDVMFRLKLKNLPPAVPELIDVLEKTLARGIIDQPEESRAFGMISACGAGLDKCLREAAADKHTSLRDCLRDSLDMHNKVRELGLLILLHFGEHAHELARLVWETWKCELGGGNPFLIMRDWVSLVRFVPGQGARRDSNRNLGRPLRLLATTSSFTTEGTRDPALAPQIALDRASIKRSLADLVEAGVFAEPECLEDPTADELKGALLDADILHHFGHGGIEDSGIESDQAYLMLKDPDGDFGKRVRWVELRECFETDKAPSLKLVVLNACELQRAGLGTRLARIGVPAVIVMQAEIDAQVIADRGFTQTFYTRLAAGDPVHAAFTRARAALWPRNCLETFVPVLILSTLDDLRFHHPQSEKARQVAEDHENRQDPFKPLWDQAAGLEASAQIEAALERFSDLASQQPGYPGVQERLTQLRGRIDRQKRVRELVEQLDRAAQEAEPRRLQDLLRDTEPVAGEPALAAALERWLRELEKRFNELRGGRRWLEARELLRTLQAMSAQLPEERRPRLPTDEVEMAARRELDQRRQHLATLARQGQWMDLVAPAQQYLALEPADEEVRGWLAQGQDQAAIAEMIDVKPVPQEAYSKIQELYGSGDWQKVIALGEEMRDKFPPTLSGKINQLALTAAAQQHKARGDWTAVKEISREVRRLDPGGSTAQELLREALRHEAEAFAASQRWEEAEADCNELLELAPENKERKRALELLGETLVGQGDQARRGHDWNRALEVSQRILQHPELKSRHNRARALHKEADEALRLLRRIKLF